MGYLAGTSRSGAFRQELPTVLSFPCNMAESLNCRLELCSSLNLQRLPGFITSKEYWVNFGLADGRRPSMFTLVGSNFWSAK